MFKIEICYSGDDQWVIDLLTFFSDRVDHLVTSRSKDGFCSWYRMRMNTKKEVIGFIEDIEATLRLYMSDDWNVRLEFNDQEIDRTIRM